jgi:hypothetical protein
MERGACTLVYFLDYMLTLCEIRRLLKMDIPSLLYKNPELEFKMNRPERIEDPSMVVRYGGLNSLSSSISSFTEAELILV